MTLLLVMNLGFAWGTGAPGTFKPEWAVNSNVYLGGIYPDVGNS